MESLGRYHYTRKLPISQRLPHRYLATRLAKQSLHLGGSGWILDCLPYTLNEQSRPNLKLHPESLLRKLLTLDDIRLSTQLSIIVNDDDKYKQIIDRKGLGAQAILNLLQAVCMRVSILISLTRLFCGYGSA